jgi:hypothetical protein
MNDKKKAIQFTLDSRIFIRSLSDAFTCTRQIAQINVDKAQYFFNISIMLDSFYKRDLLISKFCNHDVCNTNVIACSNMISYEKYFMIKFSINLFLKYYNRIKIHNDYHDLACELIKIQENLKDDLNNYIGYIKRRNELITKI